MSSVHLEGRTRFLFYPAAQPLHRASPNCATQLPRPTAPPQHSCANVQQNSDKLARFCWTSAAHSFLGPRSDSCCTFISRRAIGLLLHIHLSARDRTPAAHSSLGARSDSCCTFISRRAIRLLQHIRFSVRDMNSVTSLPVTAPVFFFIPTPCRPPSQSLRLPVPHPNPNTSPSPIPPTSAGDSKAAPASVRAYRYS